MDIGKKKKEVRIELTDDEKDRFVDVIANDLMNDRIYLRSVAEEQADGMLFETAMDDLYGDVWPEDCVDDDE